MKNFKELRIWLKGIDIAISCFQLTKTFPKEERFGLSSQITRAAVSISSNIAEGSSRNSEKDYSRFIQISLGSTYELETQLLIAKAASFGDPELLQKILIDITDEQKMIMGFSIKLRS